MELTDIIKGHPEISHRLQLICLTSGLKTIEDLIRQKDIDLCKLRKFGNKCLLETQDIRERMTGVYDNPHCKKFRKPWINPEIKLPQNDDWVLVIAQEPLTDFDVPFIAYRSNDTWYCKDTGEKIEAVKAWKHLSIFRYK